MRGLARAAVVAGLLVAVAATAGPVTGPVSGETAPQQSAAQIATEKGIWVRAPDCPRPLPIDGRLLINSLQSVEGEDHLRTYLVTGTSDNIVPAPSVFPDGDLSPVADEVIYGDSSPEYPPKERRIFTSHLDGSGPVDLTARAGLSGVNCMASWSSDGNMIAFQHSDPAPGQHPCQAGFHIWVMGADGSDARPVEPQGARLDVLRFPRWAPGGDRISADGIGLDIIMDIDGSNVETLMLTRGGADWSPDGSLIASAGYTWGSLDGRRGVWRQLVIARPDGSDKRVVVQHFVALADARRHAERITAETERSVLPSSIQWEIGPRHPRWSPNGTQIAFLAGMPFDPAGSFYRQQIEAWIYDLPSETLTRVTDGRDQGHVWLSWR